MATKVKWRNIYQSPIIVWKTAIKGVKYYYVEGVDIIRGIHRVHPGGKIGEALNIQDASQMVVKDREGL